MHTIVTNYFDGELFAKYGVTNIRGPRRMPKELKEEIIRLYQLEEINHE